MKVLRIVGLLSGVLCMSSSISCMESSLVLYEAIKKDDENKNVKDLMLLLDTRLFKVAEILVDVGANVDKVFELKRNNLLYNAIMHSRLATKYISEQQKQIAKVNEKAMKSGHWELGEVKQLDWMFSSQHRRSFNFGYRLRVQGYNGTYYWMRYSFI